MILLLLWAFSGVFLGYEAARHGIVQVIVPGLYLLAMLCWTIIGLCLAWYVSRKGSRPRPSAEEARKVYAEFAKRHETMPRGPEAKP